MTSKSTSNTANRNTRLLYGAISQNLFVLATVPATLSSTDEFMN